MKETVEQLQKDIAQLTQVMVEKAKKDQEVDVHALAEKLAGVQKELSERKIQFAGAAASVNQRSKKELETRMDELFIAKMLCTDVETHAFNKAAYDKIAADPVYAEAIDQVKTAATFDAVNAVATGVGGSGAEWIPKGFSTTLHEEIWLALEVGNLFGRIPMPFSDYTLPFNPGRIIVSAGLEGTSVSKVKPTTAKLNFTAKKIMSIVEMTDEFAQDSLVPALNFLRTQLVNGFTLGQETMCLNGDDGTNLYTTALSTAAPEDCRKLFKGIRASAMVNSVNSKVDLSSVTASVGTGTGITDNGMRAMRQLMGKYGKAPSDLAYIVSMADYFKMLNFTSYQTIYSYGQNAVILNGELGRLDGIPLIITELLPTPGVATGSSSALGGLTATGKFDGTTYTKGTCALVNKNGFLWGDRTQFTLELWRNPLSGTTNLIGAQRLDFEKVMAPSDPVVVVGYNY